MTTSPPAAARPAPVLALRVPTDEDAHHWHRAFAHPEVMEFHGGRPAELSVYQELTARQRRHDAELGYCLWTVTDAAGEVVGFTGAQPWPHAHFGPVGAIEIGWRLARTAWSPGIRDGGGPYDPGPAARGRGPLGRGDGQGAQHALARGRGAARDAPRGDVRPAGRNGAGPEVRAGAVRAAPRAARRRPA
ncbi:acetyltransferase [Streptomyces sp. SPB074]|nr:acetyltransferase [Streptomyces sp. SPB074]